MTDKWVTERLHDAYQTSYAASEVLFETQTGQQTLTLYQNPKFGRMLALDGVTQVTEADEFIYHEMLTHVPVLAHGSAKSVLIIGGGDGGMLEELLKHQTIERVVMVEIDQGVIDFSVKYLPTISNGAFDDARAEIAIADGAAYVAEATETFDIIIVDSTDPIGPGEVLFTEQFYGNCRARLKAGGVIVTQNGVPFVQGAELTQTMSAFERIFASRTCYTATIPTYTGGPMAFGWGSDNPSLLNVSKTVLANRFNNAAIDTRYYTPAVHKAAFALPGYIADLVEGVS